ncbi:MAG TPA: hypothetical protein VEY30_01990, partial [Myxococcaceae bacterium]|nr:hypothetical protein [Myxococcaceae bacterium]
MPRLTRVLYALVAAVYLLAFPYHPKLRSPNELCRLWQTRALVEYGTPELNRALVEYGRVGDLSVKEGRYYPSKAPLLSFAAVPVYAVLRAVHGGHSRAVSEVALVFWARLFLTVLPTLAMLVWLRRFLRAYLSPPLSDGLVATYALGSMALSFSQMFVSHQPTAVLLFAAFYALWRRARGEWGPGGDVAAGAFAGAALACEYTAALGVGGLIVYAVFDRLGRSGSTRDRARVLVRALGLATLGAFPFVAALMLYHWRCFGHPLVSGYRYLNDAAYQPWHLGGFLGIRYPDPRAFRLSFFSALRGLFALSPFLVLSFLGLGQLWKDTRDKALLAMSVALAAGYTYFTSSFSYDSWGWTPGPRHLTPWLPFLLLPAGLLLQALMRSTRAWTRAALGGAVGLCALSVALTATVAQVNYIPDDVSSAPFGLAWPLLRDGYFVPSVLALTGLPAPLAGGLVWFFALAAAALVLVRLAPARSEGGHRPWAVGAFAA